MWDCHFFTYTVSQRFPGACVCVCVRFEPVPRLRRFLVGGSGLMSSMHLVRRQISPEGPGQHGHRGTAGHVEEGAERIREGGGGGVGVHS